MTAHVANISLAAFPGLRHEEAAMRAIPACEAGELVEPCFGPLSASHVQLVPQCMGHLTEDLALSLKTAFEGTRMRLHANVRVLARHRFVDLSNMDDHLDWFMQAARVSRLLGAPAYSAHSGRRDSCSIDQMLANARRCADMFGCPVGVEGQYPDRNDSLLVSSWDEYRQVFDSGVPYVVDLSHLKIVAHRRRERQDTLVQEMLACERCIEVHVSDNDGTGDWHQVCAEPTWWTPLLAHINPLAVVFSEGNHLRKRPRT